MASNDLYFARKQVGDTQKHGETRDAEFKQKFTRFALISLSPARPRVSHRSKNLFCASRRIFPAKPGCHFSGRIFFHLGRNRAPRLKSLGAKNKKLSLRPASAHTRTRTSSTINELIASSFFFLFWEWKLMKSKKKEEKKKEKNY